MVVSLSSNSPAETVALGKSMGSLLTGHELVLIAGDLGAGKTLFTKGIATSLEIDENDIVSPTFTIMNRYEGRIKDKPVLFCHYDLYRLGEGSTEYMPEIDDYLEEAVQVVEWAQFLGKAYSRLRNSIKVSITPGSDRDMNERLITISSEQWNAGDCRKISV